MNYQKENAVAMNIARRALRLVARQWRTKPKVYAKGAGSDIVTSVDLAVDRLVTGSLRRAFSDDVILAEESSPDAKWGQHRTWVIDPICGTFNLSRGIPLVVTNIALVERGKLVGSWVADHLKQRVLSATGDGLRIDERKVSPQPPAARGARFDIDWGYRAELTARTRERYAAFQAEVSRTSPYNMYAVLSSINFAYVATGQLDAATTINVRPWDLLAGAFLVRQSGGVVLHFDGSAWNIHSTSAVVARNRATANIVLRLLKKHGLARVK